jgi:hypothetical protein
MEPSTAAVSGVVAVPQVAASNEQGGRVRVLGCWALAAARLSPSGIGLRMARAAGQAAQQTEAQQRGELGPLGCRLGVRLAPTNSS